ncbi:LysR family transcriptional regulator [Furfurilactobacillus sp. OKN36]
MNPYLTTFIYVYETRSFSLAAKELFITQPTVSAQIGQLEKRVGQSLFTRKRRQAIVPTPAGDLLYKQALHLREVWQETEQLLAQVNQKQRQIIQLGFSQTLAQTVAPTFLIQARHQLPQFDWHITVANSDYIADQLTKQQLTIGLIEKPVLTDPAVMTRQRLAHDQLVRIGTPTGLWFQREQGSGIAHYTDQFFQEYDLHPDQTMIINRNDLIMNLVQQGAGETIVSKSILPSEVPFTPLNAHFNRDLYVLTTKQLDAAAVTPIVTLLRTLMATLYSD